MALMDTPTDWKFTHFLTDIFRKLSKNEMAEIKILFKGIVREDVRTWTEMADTLISKGFVCRYNIVYLQKIVHHLNRPDLHSLTISYAKESEHEILHFEKDTIELAEEQEHVRIHVKGYRCQTHVDLNRIRRTLSEILMVDLKDVMPVGIQEANSVLITFMLPTMYVEAFKKLLESEKKSSFTAPLSRQGIDLVYIHEVTYQIDAEDQNEPIDNEKEKIWQLQRQIEQKDQQLKMMETELLLLKRNQRNVSSSDDESNEPQGIEKKRKYLPGFRYEEPSKKLKNDDNFESPLSHHEKPESERHLVIKPEENILTRNLVQYAGMSMTFRKMISNVPEELKKRRTPAMTPEEINTLSLYAKLNRIYPPAYILSKTK